MRYDSTLRGRFDVENDRSFEERAMTVNAGQQTLIVSQKKDKSPIADSIDPNDAKIHGVATAYMPMTSSSAT